MGTIYEGFSGALVEAIIAGIPVISSAIPMNLEAITEGETGFIHPVSDVAALHAKMQEVFNDYPEAIKRGRAARAKAIQEYDLNTISQQYVALLKQASKKTG